MQELDELRKRLNGGTIYYEDVRRLVNALKIAVLPLEQIAKLKKCGKFIPNIGKIALDEIRKKLGGK